MPINLQNYNPEDEKFWVKTGKKIANTNLWISIPNLTIAFIVWYIFPAIITQLNKVGYSLTPAQIFNLVSLPALFGATLRIFYGFLNPVFGGRNFTVFASTTLLIPAIGVGIICQNPDTPYWVLVLLAILSGFGCGNFSSSNANIPAFFPKHKQGTALGLNAGIGNLGVSVVQFTTPILIGTAVFSKIFGGPQVTTSGANLYLQNAAYFWIIPLIILILLAFFKMNNLQVKGTPKFSEQLFIFKRKDTYSLMLLYLMTFGSFAGFAAAFAAILTFKFPEVNALSYVFLGALVGGITRPLGGMLSDKVGGNKVSIFAFIGISVCIYLLIQIKSVMPFISIFVVLFAFTGIGNGSVFGMIAENFSPKEKGAAVGFISAIGAYGAFLVPQLIGKSISFTGSIDKGLYTIFFFSILCLLITYFGYSRKKITKNI